MGEKGSDSCQGLVVLAGVVGPGVGCFFVGRVFLFLTIAFVLPSVITFFLVFHGCLHLPLGSVGLVFKETLIFCWDWHFAGFSWRLRSGETVKYPRCVC